MNTKYAKMVAGLSEELVAVADRGDDATRDDLVLAALKVMILELRELKNEISSWPELGSRP